MLAVHLGGSFVVGRALLGRSSICRGAAETMALSLLLGMSLETFLAALVMAAGLPFEAAAWSAVAAWGLAAFFCFRRRLFGWTRFVVPRPRWFELAVLVVVAEKVAFALWQVARTPILFDDTLTHWSGRARSLFGGVNWSLRPESPVFLAGHIGFREYPLEIPIWRAISAWLAGGWNDVIARADSIVFFVVAIAVVWSFCLRQTGFRWLAASSAFAVASIPLMAYHTAAGYADIAVAAYGCAALACLLRRKPMLAGFVAAGMCWVKNDPLVLMVPALLCGAAVLGWIDARRDLASLSLRSTLATPGLFLLGFSTITPWLLFNFYHGLGLTPHTGDYGFRPQAVGLLWNAVAMGPSHGIFWLVVLATVAVTSRGLLSDPIGRAAVVYLAVSLVGTALLFSGTAAFQFLANGMTVNRVMLQHSPAAAIVASCGIWLAGAGFRGRAKDSMSGGGDGTTGGDGPSGFAARSRGRIRNNSALR